MHDLLFETSGSKFTMRDITVGQFGGMIGGTTAPHVERRMTGIEESKLASAKVTTRRQCQRIHGDGTGGCETIHHEPQRCRWELWGGVDDDKSEQVQAILRDTLTAQSTLYQEYNGATTGSHRRG
jgi:hypothetical protein